MRRSMTLAISTLLLIRVAGHPAKLRTPGQVVTRRPGVFGARIRRAWPVTASTPALWASIAYSGSVAFRSGRSAKTVHSGALHRERRRYRVPVWTGRGGLGPRRLHRQNLGRVAQDVAGMPARMIEVITPAGFEWFSAEPEIVEAGLPETRTTLRPSGSGTVCLSIHVGAGTDGEVPPQLTLWLTRIGLSPMWSASIRACRPTASEATALLRWRSRGSCG
jgi:hypothetical protein